MGDIVFITDKVKCKMSNMITNVHRKLPEPKLRKASKSLSERKCEHETCFINSSSANRFNPREKTH